MPDAFEFNKIAGAVLFTILLMMSLGILAEILYDSHAPERPGYAIEVAEEEGAGTAEEAKEAPMAQLLAEASAEDGEKAAKKCASCHTFEEGGANKIGPNLHGIVGRQVASHAGFSYSSAMQGFGGEWTYERLFAYLEAPKKVVPGTSMSFAGIRKDSERADLLAFLKSVTPNAPDFPAPAAPAEQPAGAQEGGQQPAAGQNGDQQGQQPAGQSN